MQGGDEMIGSTSKKLITLRSDEIYPSPYQPRREFDIYELQSLADSIAASGILQPLVVRKTAQGYELIAGERRLRAAKMAGLKKIPCILQSADETAAAIYAIIENTQRTDLSFFEEAAAIDQMIRLCSLSQSEAAERLGMAQSTLSNKLRLLRLSPELQERITAAALTERHARALLRLPEEMRTDALNRIIAEQLNLHQSEQLITEMLTPRPAQSEVPVRKAAIGDIRLFANSLSKLVSTLQGAGLDAHTRRHETDKYIEYRVRITKSSEKEYQQLRIC